MRLHSHELLEAFVYTGWESRYASEGRDALDGDSLWATTAEAGWNHLSAGLWYGLSPEQNYDELQFTIAVSKEFGPVEGYLNYTHFRFPFENGHDNEIGVGLAAPIVPFQCELSLDAYYSVDAEGTFAELGLGREWHVAKFFKLSGSAVLGMNQGYVTDGHDGLNHFALGLGAEKALTGSLTLSAHTVYNWDVDRDAALPGDELLGSFFHGSIGLQRSF